MSVLAVFLLCAALLGGAQANLVPNADFNTPNTSGVSPMYWSPWMTGDKGLPSAIHQAYLLSGGPDGSACIETGHSYEDYLELTYGSANYARFRLDSGSAIDIDADGYYRFSVCYLTNNVEEGQTAVELDQFNGSSFIESRIYNLPSVSSWTEFVAYFRPIRAEDRGFDGVDTTKLRIKLGVISSLGTARFDNVSLTRVSWSEYDANQPLTTFTPDTLTARRQSPGNVANSLNTFTVKKVNGSWWFFRPDGTPFWYRAIENPFLIGTMHPEMYFNLPSNFKEGGRTNLSYRMDTLERMGDLGFNASAITDGQVDYTVHPNGECYVHYFAPDAGDEYSTSYLLVDKNGNPPDETKPMPDPYNPSFRSWLRSYYRGQLDDLGDRFAEGGQSHPDFAGYFTDDEMGVVHLERYIWSTYASAAFVEFVQSRYSTIQDVNAAWSSQYATFNMSSFSDITKSENKAKIIKHHLDDPLAPDLEDFVRQLLREYYTLQCSILREYEVEKLGDSNNDGIADQKHMIFTNRFIGSKHPYRWTPDLELAVEVIGELNSERPGYYFDVLAVNAYPGDQMFEGVMSHDNFDLLESLAESADLPLLVSDFGVHGRDAGFPTGSTYYEDFGWFYRSVDSQADRAMCYDKMVRQWASSPYIVGAQWFQWTDVMQSKNGPLQTPVDTGSKYFRGRNSGVVDENNAFYTELANQMIATNAAIDAAFPVEHLPAGFSSQQRVVLTSDGQSGLYIYNYSTQALSDWIEGTPGTTYSVGYTLDSDAWHGVLLYDYTYGCYGCALFMYKDEF